MKFFLRTLGCKSNQYEGQAIRGSLLAGGHAEAAVPAEADVIILNTCAVTLRAAAAARAALRTALRANPALRVVLTGCAVDLAEPWPGRPAGALLIPNAKKHMIAGLLADWHGEDSAAATAAAPADRFALTVSAFSPRTRGYLKIQDGCANACAYCAVPRARGTPESRPVGDVLAEAGRLTAAGHAEIVLTGINIGAYSFDGTTLPGLVRLIAATPGLARLRLGSVEPPYVTEELVAAMREAGGIVCPHLHIPLQSGDDGVLSAMGRRYTAGVFLDKIRLLRAALPHPAITTDVITAFPGETEAAFANSLRVAETAAFARLHVFPFSPRPGTAAADLRQLPPQVATERTGRMISSGRRLAADYAAGCVGMGERVVAETAGAAGAAGLTDRYVRLRLPAGEWKKGDVLPVRVVAVDRDGTGLIGEASPADALQDPHPSACQA